MKYANALETNSGTVSTKICIRFSSAMKLGQGCTYPTLVGMIRFHLPNSGRHVHHDWNNWRLVMAYNYKLHIPESMAHVFCIPSQLSDATDTWDKIHGEKTMIKLLNLKQQDIVAVESDACIDWLIVVSFPSFQLCRLRFKSHPLLAPCMWREFSVPTWLHGYSPLGLSSHI